MRRTITFARNSKIVQQQFEVILSKSGLKKDIEGLRKKLGINTSNKKKPEGIIVIDKEKIIALLKEYKINMKWFDFMRHYLAENSFDSFLDPDALKFHIDDDLPGIDLGKNGVEESSNQIFTIEFKKTNSGKEIREVVKKAKDIIGRGYKRISKKRGMASLIYDLREEGKKYPEVRKILLENGYTSKDIPVTEDGLKKAYRREKDRRDNKNLI